MKIEFPTASASTTPASMRDEETAFVTLINQWIDAGLPECDVETLDDLEIELEERIQAARAAEGRHPFGFEVVPSIPA